MMIIKASGTHLQTSYEDVQKQGMYPKDCLNTSRGKKIAQRIGFFVAKWLDFGGTTKQKQLENKTAFETQVLRK